MKKKLLMKMAFAVLLVAVLASCKKDNSLAYPSQNESNEVEFNAEIYSGENDTRADQWTVERGIALNIIANLPNGWIYDTTGLYCMGLFGGHYAACVPSTMFSDYFLVVFPYEDIAFSIHEMVGYTSLVDNTLVRPYYEFEICNEAGPSGFVLCDGRFYPYIGTTTSFVISHKYPTTEIWDMNYNLTNFYSHINTGIYSYQGIAQGNSNMTLNNYLLSITMNCYYHFI